jgi:hypothetical protein
MRTSCIALCPPRNQRNLCKPLVAHHLMDCIAPRHTHPFQCVTRLGTPKPQFETFPAPFARMSPEVPVGQEVQSKSKSAVQGAPLGESAVLESNAVEGACGLRAGWLCARGAAHGNAHLMLRRPSKPRERVHKDVRRGFLAGGTPTAITFLVVTSRSITVGPRSHSQQVTLAKLMPSCCQKPPSW